MERKKRITVICEVRGDFDNQFIVELFDYDNTLLSKRKAYSRKSVTFYIDKFEKYKIKVTSCDKGKCISPKSASRWLIFLPQKSNIYYFIFNNMSLYKWLIKLTDKYYSNLNIESGLLLIGNKEVEIENGLGSCCLCCGTYTVTPQVYGYYGEIYPPVFRTTCSSGTQSFTISSTGTLSLEVFSASTHTRNGVGTPITKGSFIRCDETGEMTYGEEKKIDETGVCIFNNVPFGTEDNPFVFYIKQLKSDGEHSIQPGVITINMRSQAETDHVENPDPSLQTFSLTDKNYEGYPLDGTLTFEDT